MSKESDEFYREHPAWIHDAVEGGKRVRNNKRLLACPFCGGTPRLITKHFDIFNPAYQVRCEKCKAKTRLALTPSEAKTLWNRRPRSRNRIKVLGRCTSTSEQEAEQRKEQDE